MTDAAPAPAGPALAGPALEQALMWYAPLARGKLRVIDALWPLAAGPDAQRTACLIYGGFKAPCDLREMLQRQFYFFGTYYLERDLIACWSRLAAQAQVVFDVGANAGIYSLAALAANPRAQVHAFEPTPEIAERLRATAAMNALERLAVHEQAICARAGQVTLVRFRGEGDANDGMNFIQAEGRPGGERVASETLDGFCAAHGIERIDLMKMDIQGAEADALRGAAGLLRERRIGTLFMELNWGPQEAECPASQAVALLETNGYRFARPAASPRWRSAGPWLRDLADVMAAPAGEGSGT